MFLDHKPRRLAVQPPVKRRDRVFYIVSLLLLGAYFGAVFFYAIT